MRQCQCSRTHKDRIESRNRTRSVAQQTINAHAVLPKFLQLTRSLQILARSIAIFVYEPGLNLLELFQEIRYLDNEIADHRKVSERLDCHWPGRVLRQEGCASELGLVIHHVAAASANAHTARPAKCQCAVDLVLDVVEGIKDHPLFLDGHFVILEVRLCVAFRGVARNSKLDGMGHVMPLPRSMLVAVRTRALREASA